ncbi:hypothetical protein CFREI_04250 [Corynebacterium freiburgense]|nr:hypothetical protein CFREI_04250 [Corynebacterium freiburgense]
MVDLPLDEFRRCFHRLCAMVNADDALGMYLMLCGQGEEFFAMVDASPWLKDVWVLDEKPDWFLEHLWSVGFPKSKSGVCEVVKPVGEEFLIEDIFRTSRFGDFALVVTDEPDFANAVRPVYSDYLEHRIEINEIYERYLRGARSCVYAPGNIDEDNIYHNEFGVFDTNSEEFVDIFPRSARFE